MARRHPASFVGVVDEDGYVVNLPTATPPGQASANVGTVQGAPGGYPVPTLAVDPAYGYIHTITVTAVAVTVAQDVFEIVAPAGRRVKIREVILGQYTDFGDAAAEILSVIVVRGNTTAGSGGSVPVPSSLSGGSPSAATVLANNTTVATGGAPQTLRASAWNIASEWVYIPDQAERPALQPTQRLVVRITVPADSITLNATLVYEEVPL